MAREFVWTGTWDHRGSNQLGLVEQDQFDNRGVWRRFTAALTMTSTGDNCVFTQWIGDLF